MSALVVEQAPTEEPQDDSNNNNNNNNNNTIFKRFFHKKSRSPQTSRHVDYRMIGDYVLSETLGMGGYSKVKLGIHKETQQKVALKIMFGDENGVISESKKKQLKRELNVMKKVKHPNVIQLIEFHEDVEYPEANGSKKSCLVTVLEFAPGGELFDFLMFTGHFSDEATRTYLCQFLDGLEAMHSIGIAHRDLKPENLLMDSDFNLKIADFGFATEYKSDNGSQIMMNTACGTKGYLAPELLKGKKYTEKCDLFAVGIIIFTTYAGFPPFQNAVESDWWWDKLSKAWTYFESAKTTEDKSQKTLKEQKAKEKFDLFWKAHERSREFGDDFKDLVVRILHPIPEIRLDIADIRKHKWYEGKKLGKNEIKAYMDKRIRSVMKERAQKIKQQLLDQNLGSNDNHDHDHNRVRGGGGRKTAFEELEIRIDPDNEFNQNVDNITDDTFINTYYQFFTKRQPKEVAARIECVADKINAKTTFSPAQHVIMIRAAVTFDAEEDDVVIAVKQFIFDGIDAKENVINVTDESKQSDNNVNNAIKKNENNNNVNVDVVKNENARYLVAFKRLKGTPLSYKHVVEEFYNAFDIIEIMETEDLESLTV